MRCSSAAASARCWRSPAASAMRCASPTRTGRSCSCAASCCRRCSTSASIEIDERIGAHGEIVRELDLMRLQKRAARRVRRRHARLRDRADARLPLSGARAAPGRARADHRLHAGVGEPRSEPADEAGLARRHDGRRRLSVADPAALCRRGRARSLGAVAACRQPRTAAAIHAVERRADRCAPLPGQGRDPVGARRRHRRRGAGLAAGGIRHDHRLRHGRHVDRRHALRGRIRARVRHRSRRRAAARADDAHPHGGRRRRLDLRVRRRALSRRPANRRAPIPVRHAIAAAAR